VYAPINKILFTRHRCCALYKRREEEIISPLYLLFLGQLSKRILEVSLDTSCLQWSSSRRTPKCRNTESSSSKKNSSSSKVPVIPKEFQEERSEIFTSRFNSVKARTRQDELWILGAYATVRVGDDSEVKGSHRVSFGRVDSRWR
jgi:hypothetical protein